MKQKIVIKIWMHDEKYCRKKALKVVVSIPGVESVAVAGEEKDQVVVIGDGIDSVKLTWRLRKKMGHAELLSVGTTDSAQPSPPAVVEREPPAPVYVGVVAPPYYGIPHYHHYEVCEPTCYNPCAIL